MRVIRREMLIITTLLCSTTCEVGSEQRKTGPETLDRNVGPASVLPLLTGENELQRPYRPALPLVDLTPVRLVSQWVCTSCSPANSTRSASSGYRSATRGVMIRRSKNGQS